MLKILKRVFGSLKVNLSLGRNAKGGGVRVVARTAGIKQVLCVSESGCIGSRTYGVCVCVCVCRPYLNPEP